MTDFLLKLLGFVVQVGLILAGLVFFASLLAAAMVLLMVWLLRALWAKLTGQPVSPWTFQLNRQAMWQRFYQRTPGQRGNTRSAESGRDDVVDAEVTDVSVITDVEPKRFDPMR